MGTCSLPECGRPLRYAGLCNAHYLRRLRFGDPYGSGRRTTRERFEDKVLRVESGCWEWAGKLFTTTDYAQFHLWDSSTKKATLTTAHRVSYELHVGPIPEGLVIDHLCRNRACVNPEHLEAVTTAENLRRGMSPSAVAVRENRCRNGHEFTPDNTFVRIRNGRTKRECRKCIRVRDRVRRSARSMAGGGVL